MKPRGAAKGLELLVRELERAGYAGGALAITHVRNEEGARRLVALVRETWPRRPASSCPPVGFAPTTARSTA